MTQDRPQTWGEEVANSLSHGIGCLLAVASLPVLVQFAAQRGGRVSVVGASLPTARGPAARLFAFGFDAWKLTAYLEHLATGKNVQLQGATGELRLDGFGNVIRTPAWSTFSGGQSVPVTGGG